MSVDRQIYASPAAVYRALTDPFRTPDVAPGNGFGSPRCRSACDDVDRRRRVVLATVAVPLTEIASRLEVVGGADPARERQQCQP
jgi:hypothetical protein